MSRHTRLSSVLVNRQADVLAKLLVDGFIDIYDGLQPNDADDPISGGQTLGVTLRFGNPAFLPAEKGSIAANPIQSGTAVAELKKATWARCYADDHKTAVMDVTVGTADANIILPATHIVRGVMVGCTSFVHSIAKKTAGA